MSTRRHTQRRRASSPPRESFLTRVVGNYLDPIDALFAIFFSILFVLLITLSYDLLIYRGSLESYFASGYGQELFVATVSVVAVWAIIDSVVYILGEVLARRERYRLLRYVQSSSTEEAAVAAIADELDFILEPITSEAQRYELYKDIRAHLNESEPQAIGLQRADVVGAVAMVLVSVVAVLPSLLPLLLLPERTELAIRISNVVSLLIVFVTGYSWGVHTDSSPWKMGLLLMSICLAMVLFAIVLGG